MVFTENGIAMLSSVLKSKQAIQINISIMRIFNQLRKVDSFEKNFNDRLDNLENNTNKVFKVIFAKLDSINDILTPKLEPNRKKIGLKKV